MEGFPTQGDLQDESNDYNTSKLLIIIYSKATTTATSIKIVNKH